jgi:hypothetical protein
MDEYLTFRLLMQRITCMLTRVVVSGPEAQSPRKSLPYKKSAPVSVECANVVPHAGNIQTEESIKYIFRTTRPTEDSLHQSDGDLVLVSEQL